jgi:hypothetical protein
MAPHPQIVQRIVDEPRLIGGQFKSLALGYLVHDEVV